MIKNINDFISIFILFVLSISSIRLFIWAFFKHDDNVDKDISKLKLIRDYIDNVEE